MLELAAHIVETKSGHFAPEKFEDHYEDALKELLKKKQAGEQIEAPKERAPAKVINLMDALRRSVEAERGGSAKRQAPSAERPKKKKSRWRSPHISSRSRTWLKFKSPAAPANKHSGEVAPQDERWRDASASRNRRQ